VIEKGTILAYIVINLCMFVGFFFFVYLMYRSIVYHRELVKHLGYQDRFFNIDPEKRNLAMKAPYAARFFEDHIEMGREGIEEIISWSDIDQIK